MPDRNRVYFDDILESIRRIEEYTKGMSYDQFRENQLVTDAVIRNLEVIGEAVKNISSETKKKYPDIEWKKIAGIRDILIHEYFGINLEIIWDVVVNKVPELKESISDIVRY